MKRSTKHDLGIWLAAASAAHVVSVLPRTAEKWMRQDDKPLSRDWLRLAEDAASMVDYGLQHVFMARETGLEIDGYSAIKSYGSLNRAITSPFLYRVT